MPKITHCILPLLGQVPQSQVDKANHRGRGCISRADGRLGEPTGSLGRQRRRKTAGFWPREAAFGGAHGLLQRSKQVKELRKKSPSKPKRPLHSVLIFACLSRSLQYGQLIWILQVKDKSVRNILKHKDWGWNKDISDKSWGGSSSADLD